MYTKLQHKEKSIQIYKICYVSMICTIGSGEKPFSSNNKNNENSSVSPTVRRVDRDSATIRRTK